MKFSKMAHKVNHCKRMKSDYKGFMYGNVAIVNIEASNNNGTDRLKLLGETTTFNL